MTEADRIIASMLRQGCGTTADGSDIVYESYYNSDAEAVEYLEKQGIVEILSRRTPGSKFITFRYK